MGTLPVSGAVSRFGAAGLVAGTLSVSVVVKGGNAREFGNFRFGVVVFVVVMLPVTGAVALVGAAVLVVVTLSFSVIAEKGNCRTL